MNIEGNISMDFQQTINKVPYNRRVNKIETCFIDRHLYSSKATMLDK